MATKILTRGFSVSRPGAVLFNEFGWYCNQQGERRVFISLEAGFFKPRDTGLRSCIRKAISDLFETDIKRVRTGITLIWTGYQADLAQFIGTEAVVLRGDLSQAKRLIDIIKWVLGQSEYRQRSLKYDPKTRSCFTKARDGNSTTLLRSPRLRECSYWEQANGGDSVSYIVKGSKSIGGKEDEGSI